MLPGQPIHEISSSARTYQTYQVGMMSDAKMSSLQIQPGLDAGTLAELRQYYKTSVGYREHLQLKGAAYFERFVAVVCDCSSASDLILDLGCGTGESTGEIARRGRKVIGTDISSLFMQSQARNSSSTFCRFVTSDASRLPFSDHSFDVVCAMEFIEHVWPVEGVLGEMHRVLKPDGRIVIVSPNLLSPLWPLRDFLQMLTRHRFRPPLYSSYQEALSFLRRSCHLSLKKMLSIKPEFISRRPDLGHADFGGDFDAVYFSNARDISLFLRQTGYRVRLAVDPSGSIRSLLRTWAARIMGSMWTSFTLLGTKPR